MYGILPPLNYVFTNIETDLLQRHSTLKTRLFQKSLDSLPKQPVLLKSGGVVDVPCFVVDLCQAIRKHFDTEGIFRKAGSSSRQKEIKVFN